MHEIEDLFDRRFDGVAAMRRFRDRLRWHVAVFGTARRAPARCGSSARSSARSGRIQRQRERMEQLAGSVPLATPAQRRIANRAEAIVRRDVGRRDDMSSPSAWA